MAWGTPGPSSGGPLLHPRHVAEPRAAAPDSRSAPGLFLLADELHPAEGCYGVSRCIQGECERTRAPPGVLAHWTFKSTNSMSSESLIWNN